MEALNINRLSKLYHLRPSQRERQRLLDASLHQAFEEDLDAALADVGIEDYGEICVRLVHVPLSFNFGQSQNETSRHWSRIIASQIRLELEKGGDNVIRYRSRLHALIAFADDISHNKLQHSWAWNQIGLSDLSADASLSQARSQLVTALLREPAAILSVFKRLAAKQRLLPCLLELSSGDRTLLVEGLMSEVGVERRWLETKPELVNATGADLSAPLSENSLSRSSILSHLLANAGEAASLPLAPRIWVILILQELEPILFRRAPEVISQAISTVEKRLLPVLMSGIEAAQNEAAETSEQSQSIEQTRPDKIDNLADGGTVGQQQQDKTEARTTNPVDKTQIDKTLAEKPIEQTQDERQAPFDEPTPEIIHSEFAGLFLLLSVLAETADDAKTSLINQIAAEPAFSARPLSWVLFQITSHWLTIPTGDPALREFCAIDIDADWPGSSCDEVTSLEANALDVYVTEIESRVLARYSPEGIDQSSVVETLCRRGARLLIDNGWLELVFELNDVDTNIRRAGLDLDPGFVPWLGKVVKIRYE